MADVVEIELTDIKQSTQGSVDVGGNNATLAHGGDTLTVYCPTEIKGVKMGKVKIQAQVRTRAGWKVRPGQIGKDGASGNYAHTVDKELLSGETWTIGPVVENQVSTSDEAIKAANAGETAWTGMDAFIYDQNIFVTLVWAEDDQGARVGVSTVTDTTLYWHIYDPDGVKELAKGQDFSIDECKKAIIARATADKISAYHWTITDYAGTVKDTGDHAPEGFPWVWVAVAVAIIAVVAVILLLYMRSGHTAPAGVPAAAPVAPVIVIPQAVA
jgi:hypothetical protein